MPDWAVQLRTELTSTGWGKREGWVPLFALRSEAALLGLQVRYWYSDMAPVYQRVFVGFVRESLCPFVEWVQEQGNEWRREGYTPVVALYEQCEKFTTPVQIEEWNSLGSVFKKLSEDREIYDAYFLALELLTVTRHLLTMKMDSSLDSPPLMKIERILRYLNLQHQWRVEGKAGDAYPSSPNYGELIADAYLTALETECPTPEWLVKG